MRDGCCSCSSHKCDRQAKHPRTQNGLTDASIEEWQIRGWWESWPDANIGIATGSRSGFVVLDVDSYKGGEDSLGRLGQLPHTVESLTGGGGRHILFTHPGTVVGNSANKIGAGLDVRGDGGYIVAPPSLHKSGKRYEWESSSDPSETPLAPFPDAILAAIATSSVALADSGDDSIPIPQGQRNQTLASIAGSMRRKGVPSSVIATAIRETNLARCEPPLADSEVSAIAKSVCRYKPAAPLAPHRESVPEKKGAPVHDIKTGAVIEHDNLLRTYASLCRVLREPALRSSIFGNKPLEFNEMLCGPTIGRRPVADTDYGKLREAIENRFEDEKGRGLRFSTEDISQAVRQIAAEKPYHPVRDYLQGIEWDHVPRINLLLSEVLHSESSDLTQTLLRRWFIAAVARAMRPGCKVDSVLIFVGKQGAGKSRFFATLAGEFFSDTAFDVASKDAYLVLSRAWIVEWAELEAMQRARDAGAVKSFLTSCSDIFRPPYGREVVAVKRSCVIVGTTNEREFLTDSTGNRRYWVVQAGTPVDLEKLAAWRDQLWAEARVAYESGEQWHLTYDEERQLAGSHKDHERHDSWEDQVVGFAETVDEKIVGPLTTSLVLEKAITKPMGQWTRADQMRVVSIMERNGWESVRRRVGEGRMYVWVRQEKQVGLTLGLEPIHSPSHGDD